MFFSYTYDIIYTREIVNTISFIDTRKKAAGGSKMNDAAKEARRAYKRAWNKAHPEKIKQYQETYWTRKAEAAKAAEKEAPGETAKTQEI